MNVGARLIAASLLSLLWLSVAFADDAIKALDTDRNGTVDIEEAEASASKIFYAIDRDKDGT